MPVRPTDSTMPRPLDRQASPPHTGRFSRTTEEQQQRQSPTSGRRNPYTPEARERLPPDRATRQKLIERYLQKAYAVAAVEASEPLCHGRVALIGLALLELIRGVAWWDGAMPGSVFGVHFLTTTTDAICVMSMLPLFSSGTKGDCVQVGCVGPTLTLIFAMFVVDLAALCTFLVLATPRPLSPGSRSFIDVAEAIVGAWDLALVASVFLQTVLCTSSWRIYKVLRMNGLYPPGSMPAGMGTIDDVSLWELVCEAEDVKLINECDCKKSAMDTATTTASSHEPPV